MPANFLPETDKLPVLFVGHGSPTNAIEDNPFSRAWIEIGRSLPTPSAILCVSAHWTTLGTHVTAEDNPKTIYDFYGFPRALYEMKYPAPGSPVLAELIHQTLQQTTVHADTTWGLDHGTWSVLSRMFPQANIPVVQLSLDASQPPEYHYELAKSLAALRTRGVMIVGSGNIVHNLGMVQWADKAYDWAEEYDDKVKHWILNHDHDSIIHYHRQGKIAQLAIPTNEHYLPLLYTLALQEKDDPLTFFAEQISLGAISMRSMRIG